MSLPEFQDEAQFRSKWIAPFLSKLGYILPKHIHGTSEQGRDFYFAEHDKFGHLRFLVAQAKCGDIGAGDVELDKLLNQVRRCFAVRLRHHKGADNQRVSAVYIMASGKISSRAREYISDAMTQEHYGENVYYLDGEALYNAERYATYLDDRLLRQRLLALESEAAFNLKTLKKLLDSVPSKKLLFYPCRMLAIDDVLRNPLPEHILPVASVPINYIWIHYQELNKNVVPYNLSFDEGGIATYAKLATTAQHLTIALQAACKAAIARLDAQYSLELEVEVEEDQAENKPE